ncbi:MAG: tetratricopeptide repeat protein [Cellulosilyticaceae bacterium]
MEVICPYCGKIQEAPVDCLGCGQNIKWVDQLYRQSQTVYTKGYVLAGERNLTEALQFLKEATQLNKYNVMAHNLLGIIYFELGDVGNALKTWILSTSIQKEDNLASDYLEKIHKENKALEKYKQAIKLYNEAAEYLKNKNDDMAVIRLKKAIHLHQQFVDARNLLALTYIEQAKYTKAMEQVKRVLAIDAYNPNALRYLKEVQYHQVECKNKENELLDTKKQISLKSYGGAHKVINRGHVLGTAIIYFIFGVVCMLCVQVALVLPSKTEALQSALDTVTRKAEDDLGKLRGSLAEANTQITLLTDENKKITAQKEELQSMNSKLAQQSRINTVIELKNTKKWVEGAELLYRIAPEQLDAAYKEQYDELVKVVYPKAADVIYAEGLSQYNRREYVEAFAQFEKVQMYVPKTTVAANSLYYMGMIEEQNSQMDKAMQYYETVCAEYSGISAYYKAKERLKKIAG